MKQNDITDIEVRRLKSQNIENVFNIYENEDGQYFYNLLRTVNFPKDLNPLFYDQYVVKPKDTWPVISWKAYKNVKLWWLLCSLNNIQDPLGELPPGKVIKVLKNDLVQEVLAEIRNA